MSRKATAQPRKVCFVTGTRAEFGLMASTLRAISQTRGLQLQIIVTGMHLDRSHGRSIDQIRREGWTIDATVAWPAAGSSATSTAESTGRAMAAIAAAIARLSSDIVLVVGDRVEAFAAASAGHISRRIVAHVHGGDRAEGQVDDSLRHAITKLAHIHFPATVGSADRLRRLGEDARRIYRVGSPGLDGIRKQAASFSDIAIRFPELKRHRYALVLLHPTDPDETAEFKRAIMLNSALSNAGISQRIIVWPNNDPGARGIIKAWKLLASEAGVYSAINLPRGEFLGLMRDAAMLIGNSSSGIIEAASFGTPVIDVGDRQKGRERGKNVTTVPFKQGELHRAILQTWHGGKPVRYRSHNIYSRGSSGERIAATLKTISFDDALRRKLIAY